MASLNPFSSSTRILRRFLTLVELLQIPYGLLGVFYELGILEFVPVDGHTNKTIFVR